MTQYVQLSEDETKIVSWFGGPQRITSDKPGYAEIADDDPRYIAFMTLHGATGSVAEAIRSGTWVAPADPAT